MAKLLTLIPSATKYARVELHGTAYEIWAVNPVTGKPGTDIPYTEAVQLLTLQPPVVALLPKVENGKFVQQLSERDAALVADSSRSAYGTLTSRATDIPNSSKEDEIEALKEQKSKLEADSQETKDQLAKALAEIESLKKAAAKSKPKQD